MNLEIDNIIYNQPSNDHNFIKSLEEFITILKEINIEYYIIGSTAMQAYCNYVRRIPNDIDITCSKIAIGKIKDFCSKNEEFKFIEHSVASKVISKSKYCLHLIPSFMVNIDKMSNKVLGEVKVFYEDDVHFNELTFFSNEKNVRIQVPSFERAFCLNLFSPLDSNIISDVIYTLESNILNEQKFKKVYELTGLMKNTIKRRLLEILRILTKLEKAKQIDELKKLVRTIDKV